MIQYDSQFSISFLCRQDDNHFPPTTPFPFVNIYWLVKKTPNHVLINVSHLACICCLLCFSVYLRGQQLAAKARASAVQILGQLQCVFNRDHPEALQTLLRKDLHV